MEFFELTNDAGVATLKLNRPPVNALNFAMQAEMVEAAKIFLGGSLGVDPQLAQLHEKAVPLVELVGVLEQLLLDRFGARRRPQPVQ